MIKKILNNNLILIVLIMFMFIRFDVKKQRIINEYKLLKYNNHLFMQVTLNKKLCLLIIDSGSGKSFIDISKSKVFKFKYIEFGNQKFVGIGGISQMYIIYDYTISNIQNEFMGVNLEQLTNYMKENFGTTLEIVGILGTDFLVNHNAILNYKNNTIIYN